MERTRRDPIGEKPTASEKKRKEKKKRNSASIGAEL